MKKALLLSLVMSTGIMGSSTAIIPAPGGPAVVAPIMPAAIAPTGIYGFCLRNHNLILSLIIVGGLLIEDYRKNTPTLLELAYNTLKNFPTF